MPEPISRAEKKLLRELENNLNYKFRNRALLKNALTHKSYANEKRLEASDHNERLEFLGDAVLELVVSHLLMENYSDSPEGELSKLRASLVNEKTLAKVAREHELGKYLYLGKGEEMGQGREKPSLLSDAVEAVLGAVYLDRGFGKAYRVIRRIALELFEQVGTEGFYKDYKTLLQEKAQTLFRTVPKYKLVEETGPDHDKTFTVNLMIKGDVLGVGKGKSKKGAEQNAAKEALGAIEKTAPQNSEMASAPAGSL